MIYIRLNPIIRSYRSLVYQECLDFLVIFHPVQLFNIDVNFSSKTGLLEFVKVAPQLLQIISNVETKVQVVGFYKMSDLMNN